MNEKGIENMVQRRPTKRRESSKTKHFESPHGPATATDVIQPAPTNDSNRQSMNEEEEKDEARNKNIEPSQQKRNNSGKFHFQTNRSSLVEAGGEITTSLAQHPNVIEDEGSSIISEEDQPGAFREGADNNNNQDDMETYLNDTIEIEPDDDPFVQIEQEKPLDAEVVEEHDLQKEVQQKIKERTIDPISVTIAGNNETKNASPRSKSTTVLILLMVGLVFLGISITLGLTLPSKENDSNTITSTPTTTIIMTDEPTMPPTSSISDLEFAKNLFTPLSGTETLSDVSSPQYEALWWIVHDDPGTVSIQKEAEATTLIERYVMALIYFATGGPDWFTQLNFLGRESICDWRIEVGTINNGIKCNPDGSAVGLRLNGNNLNGTLPFEISALSSLEVISVMGSNLHGTIPSSLGKLTLLQGIQFTESFLSGTIPESITNLRKLEWLSLDGNELTGTIPSGLTTISSLRYILLEYNFFTGTIPNVVTTTTSSNVWKLEQLWLGWNMLVGTIPESIYDSRIVTSLEVLSVWGNSLTGSLSDSLGDLTNLWIIDTEMNNMTGTIPNTIGNLLDMEDIYLDGNNFSGTIPSEIGLLTRLDILWLHENQLSGTVPIELSALSPSFVTLYGNKLTGSLDSFCNNQTPILTQMEADCGGITPQVDCSCCSTCCDASTGDCEVNMEAICTLDKSSFDHPNGPYYSESSGTICDCIDNDDPEEMKNVTMVLSCRDTQCQSCNRDGTICSETQNLTFHYGPDGIWDSVQFIFQYVVGRNDTITLDITYLEDYSMECEVTVNDEVCNGCYFAQCSDGFGGLDVRCENVDGAGYVDLCDDQRDDDDGPLAVFALQDPAILSGCPLRIDSVL